MAIPAEIRARLEDPERTVVAVVGASNDPRKYGCIILRDLEAKGFQVVPVNPNQSEVCGHRSYPDIASIPGEVHIADFVVPPEVAIEVVRDLPPGRVESLWFQPGSFDPSVVREARERFERVIAGPCIMVETR